MMNDVVLDTLTEKIQRQERLITKLQAELQRARETSVESFLGPLRLREAVLLYVGQDAAGFSKQIAQDFGSEIARAISNSLFVLDNAPISPEVREAFRKATNHGMSRW